MQALTFRSVLPLALVLSFAQAAAAEQLAFPGAEGEGRYAQGGRGGRVIYVTTLDDAGPGSLRAAVEASGPRTVVFALSGTIALASPLVVSQGRLTIAGQTAPGDGITLRNHALRIEADDVVLRFIRSRLGDAAGADDDALSVGSGQRIIIDHVSTSWSTDEALSVSVTRADRPGPGYQHVTVQWSLMAESLNCNVPKKGACHGFGSLLRGGRGSRLSMHHNIWASHYDRMPRPGNYHAAAVDPIGGYYDFRANLFYNWGQLRAGYNMDSKGELSSYNFVGNAYLSGPNSKGANAFQESNAVARAYFAGNSMNGVVPAKPYSLVLADHKTLPDGLPAGYALAEPLPLAPITAEPVTELPALLLARAGASLLRDAVDLRLLDDIRQGKGRLINSQTEVGGWPALRSLPAPLDSDQDGLPDAWELAQGLNPKDAADAAGLKPGSGYSWLEHYLNGLVAHIIR